MRETKFWSPDELAKFRSLVSEGKPVREICEALGRSHDSVRSQVRKLKPTIPKEEAVAIQTSGQTSQIESLQRQVWELQQASQPQRVPVETSAVSPVEPAELWKRAEEEGAKRIQYAMERSQFKVAFDDGPIAISFISDQHIAPGTPCDFKRMREDAELIKATPGLYACLGGDGADNHIKHRAAVLAARSQPDEQWDLYEYYLAIFAEKIFVLISGNHDAWSNEVAGIDMVAQIARRQKLCYSPAEARISVRVGNVDYKVGVRHQYRYNSSFNQGHTVKQWLRMGDEAFDVGCICHHHESHVEPYTFHGLQRWVCRPGSYQLMSGYSWQYGFNMARPTCPTFILFGDGRRIIGFNDIRDAVKTLAAERGGK